jgi:predicted GNAT family N-acyltransferase
MSDLDYVIEPLGSHHDRAAFSCGIVRLDTYLQRQATQDNRNDFAVPFALIDKNSGAVAGYYTLSSLHIDMGELPTEVTRKLPRYPTAPATLLGRLAIDKKYQGRKLGEMLLMDALYRSLNSSHEIASMAVVVDAKDEKVRSFYERYDFIQFPNSPLRLFLPMKSIAKMFK